MNRNIRDGTKEGNKLGRIKNMTYKNLMYVIKAIQAKGYDFAESEKLARNIFAEFALCPMGKSIERRVSEILTKEEWKKEFCVND